MLFGTILFLILALIAVVSAVGMLTSTNAVHAALFLVTNFVCTALFYLGLNAPFLAMAQITVYAGAIMVLFLFVIMLLGAKQVTLRSALRWHAPLAVVLVVMLIGVAGVMAFSPVVKNNLLSPLPLQEANVAFGSPQAVGEALFSNYLLPFQMVGILLLVAMIGAVVLTREEKKPTQQPSPEESSPAGE
jgi:NADH-quinone oxidoreductase subunit J